MAVQDPYKVLGVPNNATEEQIKSAYRELAKKYHPDNYADSPLSDLANEKMQEVNEAYDILVKQFRTSGGGTASSQGYDANANNGYQNANNSRFQDIRRLIQQNRLVESEELLDGTPMPSRDAEWYFLKGTVYFQRGWLEDAMNHFSTACRLNPNNPEYRAAMNRMMWQKQGNVGSPGGGMYRQGGAGVPGGRGGGCSSCDMCSSLICADCCCECMGGDLIACC